MAHISTTYCVDGHALNRLAAITPTELARVVRGVLFRRESSPLHSIGKVESPVVECRDGWAAEEA